MTKQIRCECGFIARGDYDDQVAGVIRGHLASDHPTLLATISQEDGSFQIVALPGRGLIGVMPFNVASGTVAPEPITLRPPLAARAACDAARLP